MNRYLMGVLGLLLPLGPLMAEGPPKRLPEVKGASFQAADKPADKADKAEDGKTDNGKSENGKSEGAPTVSITLYDREGRVIPFREGFQHTGAGVIDVAQPSPDTVVITMTGVAVAGCHPCKKSVAAQDFDLTQCFEVKGDKLGGKCLKLTLEGRVIGLLRSHKCGGGCADESTACAAVHGGEVEVASFCAPARSVCKGDNLSVNDHRGPVCAPIVPGKYTLHQSFHISASSPCHLLCCKCASAEFAPDPALDPLWISYWEPFHGAIKKDFGFQVTVKVVVE
jgi:hypothetical protein